MTAPTPVGIGEDAGQLQFLSSCVFSFHKMLHLTKQNKTKHAVIKLVVMAYCVKLQRMEIKQTGELPTIEKRNEPKSKELGMTLFWAIKGYRS